MKIDNNSNLATGLGKDQSVQPPRTTKAGAGNSAAQKQRADMDDFSGGDHVEISDFATQTLDQLSAQAASGDPGKIEQLQAAYNSGSYHVPASRIAASLISYWLAE